MTTGVRDSNNEFLLNGGLGESPVGWRKLTVWSGADSSASELELRVPKGPKHFHSARRSLKRQLPPHPYTKEVQTTFKGYFKVQMPGYQVNEAGLPDPWNFGHVPLEPQDHYKVIEKLRTQVYGTGFHPGVFAAEAPKALDMIASSALRLRRGLLCAALGDWRGIIKNFGEPSAPNTSRGGRDRRVDSIHRLKTACLDVERGKRVLSTLWLEIQYGWKPLIKDIEDGAGYLAFAMNNGNVPQKKVSASREITRTESFENQKFGPTTKTTVSKIRYTITGLRIESPFIPSLESTAGIAWERLPYSFVCDWAVPIGDYLQALRTAHDLQGDVVCTVTQETDFGEWRVSSPAQFAETVVGFGGDARAYVNLFNITRTVGSEIYPPTPVGDLSPSSIFKSWTRAGNAIALLTNLRFHEGDRVGIKKLLQATPVR